VPGRGLRVKSSWAPEPPSGMVTSADMGWKLG
jgi:hypothetical protein